MPFLGKQPGVTALALADGSVNSANILDATIATGDIANAAITYAKLQNVSATSLLGRPTSTNILLQSEDFTTSWVGPATIAQDSTGPDGVANSATTFTDTSTLVVNDKKQSLTIPNDSATYTVSVFIKKTAGATIEAGVLFYMSGGSNLNTSICINTNTGAVVKRSSTLTPLSITSESYLDFWRVSFTQANDSSGNTSANVWLIPVMCAIGAATYDQTQVGSNVFYGAQLELSTYPASYIATTTTAVTANGGPGGIEEIGPLAIRTMINVEDGANNYTHPSAHTIGFINGLQVALDDKAALASPSLSGTPTAPTATAGANTTQVATTQFVTTAVGSGSYTHPTNHLPSIITQDATNRFVTDAEKAAWNAKADTKADVGLGNADNTSDANKPVSTATLTALNAKADDTAISNIDNTSDANKPVSTATQTALNAKVDDARVLTDVPAGAVFTDTNTVYTHPNHSGEITSTADGATVIASNIVDEDNLKISNTGTNGQYLQKQSGNAGGMTWETIQSGSYNAWAIKTTTYTAINGDQLIANHASTPFTISLPASPSIGDTVIIKNVGAALVTVAKNGAFTRINSVVEDATLPTGNAAQLVYVDSTIGWTTL